MASLSSTQYLASRVILFLSALLLWAGMFACQPRPQPTDSLESARKAAVERQRRVIFNNDGDDLLHLAGPATAEKFLSVRTDHAAGTMVDSVFLRHPAFFPETRLLEPVTQPHLEMMTRMVGRIRAEVLAASRRKGRPILMSVRILPTLSQNLHFGFDVEQWARRGFLDLIVVGGGYDPFTMPAKDMIERGNQWGVPVGGRLPVQVAPGDSVQRLLPVADELAGAGDRLHSLEFRLKLAGPRKRDTVSVHLNGERLRLTRRQPDWLIGPVPEQAMRRGNNVVKVKLAAAAPSALTLAALELEVTYRR